MCLFYLYIAESIHKSIPESLRQGFEQRFKHLKTLKRLLPKARSPVRIGGKTELKISNYIPFLLFYRGDFPQVMAKNKLPSAARQEPVRRG
ncbi:MAG: hypothetical protein APF81_22880 [Desulfosporosinus sp. BRH_c37]|nr:MAG: hypothetical protein APF81_22880 [Desulfosporosinus sp. BRH_c37]